MVTKLNQKLLIQTFLIVFWIIIWISINALPDDMNEMLKSLVHFLNGSRSISAILLSSVSIILVFYLIITKKVKTFSTILKLFILYFIFQFIGLVFNDERIIELNSTYLLLYSLGTISMLMIIEIEKLYKLLPYFFYISISILIIASLVVLILSNESIAILFRGDFYRLILADETFLNHSAPKITGITRSFGIISLWLIIMFSLKKRNNFISPLIFIIIIVLSIGIWLSQSRGSILCYYISAIFFLIFLNKFNKYKKLLIILSITFFSIFLSHIIVTLIKNDMSPKEKLNEEILVNKNYLPRVFEVESGTSGRIALWKKALEKYEKKKFFGYGPQGDRVILNNELKTYGNNVSNTIIYGLLSGGYFSLIILISIYIYTIYLLLNFFSKNNVILNIIELNKENLLVLTSIVYIIFFMVRSIFENSFGVFSIDFLILILSLFVLENNKKLISN